LKILSSEKWLSSYWWKRFLEVHKKHHIKMMWVKGHASNKENNRCDELAVAASKSAHLLIDEGYVNSKKKCGIGFVGLEMYL
jgi:ribonuclease HI